MLEKDNHLNIPVAADVLCRLQVYDQPRAASTREIHGQQNDTSAPLPSPPSALQQAPQKRGIPAKFVNDSAATNYNYNCSRCTRFTNLCTVPREKKLATIDNLFDKIMSNI